MARSILPYDVRTKMHLTHFNSVVDTEAARHRTRGETAVGSANRHRTRGADEPPRRGCPPLSDPPAHQHFRRSRMSRSVVVGFLLTLASAFFFAVSGPIAKTMYAIGWTPGSVVLIRLAGSAILLLIPTLISLRGRWDEVLRHWRTVVIYGLVSMAGVQGFYFVAVEHLTVAVALLLEMTAPMLIVFWIWARTRTRPATVTFIGVVVSMIGLLLVLNLRGSSISIFGAFMAMAAAVCLASYFLVSAKDTITLPPVALTGLGMGVGSLAMSLIV